jgi:hypothetical protein
VTTLSDIGSRVELVSMDAHFHDISIGLYRQDRGDGPLGVVHTYSTKPGADARVAFVVQAMAVLGGLEVSGDAADLFRFPCGQWHASAVKRAFLEACKVDPAVQPTARPLEIVDKKSGQQIRVESLGSGSYRVLSDAPEGETSRAPAIARGLVKLGELQPGDTDSACSFPCGNEHDALVGLLLVRALNVRATLQAEEQAASRGVLAAPGPPQETGG